jgi:acetylornithine deacetylase
MNRVAEELDLEKFGSPTLSDQALIPWPSVKIGPGDSARSHTADEYIFLQEIREGIQGYIAIINKYAELSSNQL